MTYQRDKEKVKAYNKMRYETQREHILKLNKESRERNDDKIKERRKVYMEKNKEQIKMKKQEKIVCECGVILCSGGKHKHIKTLKHKRLLEAKNEFKIINN